MTKANNVLLFLCLILMTAPLSAQVYLTGLNGNGVIKEYLQNASVQREQRSNPLSLPFFEDFSEQNPFPSPDRWEDDFAFVNRTFADNPPSMGVATLDALNQNGELYSTLSQNQSVGDLLTSRPINLDTYTEVNPISISTTELFYFDNISGTYLPSDSLWYVSGPNVLNCNSQPATFTVDMDIIYIWHNPPDSSFIPANAALYYFDGSQYVSIPYFFTGHYAPADSMYFSFYFQPQGRSANAPEPADSLVLQFSADGNWYTVWRAAGESVKPFEQVMIPITDTVYFAADFQFRFYNYVSSGGPTNPSWNNNCDYWHVDYIYLNKGRTQGDTIPDDVCFTDQRIAFIKNYTQVPWEHFKEVPSLREDTIRFTVRNLSEDAKNISRKLNVYLYPTSLIYNPNSSSENVGAYGDSLTRFPVASNLFTSSQPDSVHYYARFIASGGLAQDEAFYGSNDTVFQDIFFKQYYAYDDGTAENGFGLGGIGTQNARLAYRYATVKPDTLRGVYMYFNPTVNNFTGEKYFYLMVWSHSNGKPSAVRCEQMGEQPLFEDGAYSFVYYPLDTPLYVTDTFYIGWKQTTTDLLNIGFDANNNTRQHILYNINGVWEACPYDGSLMMRPLFSTTPFLSTPDVPMSQSVSVYPNPCSGQLYLRLPDEEKAEIRISDMQGRVLYAGSVGAEGLDTSPFASGMYMVTVIFGGKQSTSRLMIQ